MIDDQIMWWKNWAKIKAFKVIIKGIGNGNSTSFRRGNAVVVWDLPNSIPTITAAVT